jgi:hypothetical protein
MEQISCQGYGSFAGWTIEGTSVVSKMDNHKPAVVDDVHSLIALRATKLRGLQRAVRNEMLRQHHNSLYAPHTL